MEKIYVTEAGMWVTKSEYDSLKKIIHNRKKVYTSEFVECDFNENNMIYNEEIKDKI